MGLTATFLWLQSVVHEAAPAKAPDEAGFELAIPERNHLRRTYSFTTMHRCVAVLCRGFWLAMLLKGLVLKVAYRWPQNHYENFSRIMLFNLIPM